jgi:phosphoribosylglycinamide formyltransferase-1
VLDTDTEDSLSDKILREEHRIYSDAVKIVLEGRFKIEGRRVIQLATQPVHE